MVSNRGMDSARRDYRLIGFAVVGLSILASIGVALLLRPRTQFELEHARAQAANPRWLQVEITTQDNRQEYQENEPIYIIPHFSSTVRYKYKIEVAEYESESTIEYLHISNGKVVARELTGIVCCSSRLVGLDTQPYSPRTITPLRLGPGHYQIYLTTRRVVMWDTGPQEYSPSSFEVTSNLLKLRVVANKTDK